MPQQITEQNIGAFKQLYDNYKDNPSFYDAHNQRDEVLSAVSLYENHLAEVERHRDIMGKYVDYHPKIETEKPAQLTLNKELDTEMPDTFDMGSLGELVTSQEDSLNTIKAELPKYEGQLGILDKKYNAEANNPKAQAETANQYNEMLDEYQDLITNHNSMIGRLDTNVNRYNTLIESEKSNVVPKAPVDNLGVIDDLKLLYQAITTGTVGGFENIAGVIARSIESGNVSAKDASIIANIINKSELKQEMLSLQGSEAQERIFNLFTAGDIQQTLFQIPYSVIAMAASMSGLGVTKLLLKAAPKGVSGLVAAAVALIASGTFAYRATKNQFVRDQRDLMFRLSPDATEEHWENWRKIIMDDANNYALFEAVPEAAGNLLLARLYMTPAKVLNPLINNITSKVARGLASALTKYGFTLAEEIPTELITALGQGRIEALTGLREQVSESTWEEIKRTLGEILPQTIMTSGILAGAGGMISGTVNKIKGQKIPATAIPKKAVPMFTELETAKAEKPKAEPAEVKRTELIDELNRGLAEAGMGIEELGTYLAKSDMTVEEINALADELEGKGAITKAISRVEKIKKEVPGAFIDFTAEAEIARKGGKQLVDKSTLGKEEPKSEQKETKEIKPKAEKVVEKKAETIEKPKEAVIVPKKVEKTVEVRKIGDSTYTTQPDGTIIRKNRWGKEFPSSSQELNAAIKRSEAGKKSEITKGRNIVLIKQKWIDQGDMPAVELMQGKNLSNDYDMSEFRIGPNVAFAKKMFDDDQTRKANYDDITTASVEPLIAKYGYGAVMDRDGNVDSDKILGLVEKEALDGMEGKFNLAPEERQKEADFRGAIDEASRVTTENEELKKELADLKADKDVKQKELTLFAEIDELIEEEKHEQDKKDIKGKVEKVTEEPKGAVSKPDEAKDTRKAEEIESAIKFIKTEQETLNKLKKEGKDTKNIEESIDDAKTRLAEIGISEGVIKFEGLSKDLQAEGKKLGIHTSNFATTFKEYIDGKLTALPSAQESLSKLKAFFEKVLAYLKTALKDESGFIRFLPSKKATEAELEQVATVEKIEETLERHGLDEIPLDEAKKWEDVFERASKSKDDAMYTAKDIIKNHRVLTNEESANLMITETELEDLIDSSLEEIANAVDSGNKKEQRRHTVIMNGALSDLNEVLEALRYGSREAGRALNIIQVALKKERGEYKVGKILQRAKVAKGVKLTEKEQQEFVELGDKIRVLEKKEANLTKDIAELQEKLSKEDAITNFRTTRKSVTRKRTQSALSNERKSLFDNLNKIGYRLNDVIGLTYESATIISKLAVNYLESGITELDAIVDKIQNKVPDLSKKDVYDSIGGRIKSTKKKVVKETKQAINDLKTEAKLLGQIEDAYDGIFDEGKPRKKPTAKIAELQSKLRALKKQTNKTNLEAATLLRIQHKIDDIQTQLRFGIRDIKQSKGEESQDIKNARQELSELRRLMATNDKIADLENQLKTGNFKVPVKIQKVVKNADLLEAQVKLSQLRRQVRERTHALAPRSKYELFIDIITLPRTLKATADISGVLRQGIFIAARHPIFAAKAAIVSTKAYFSQDTADSIYNSIINDPNFHIAEKAGLFIAALDNYMMKGKEEMFMSSLGEKIPVYGHVIKGSNRNMASHLNLIRMYAFNQFLNNYPNATNEELKAWADFINISSGRGNLGKLNKIADVLSLGLFSPKFSWSRIQLPFQIFKHWKHPNVRKEITKHILAFNAMAGTALFLASLAGFDVGDDPEDSDWGKIKEGDTRIDTFGGMQQPVRLMTMIMLQALDRVGIVETKRDLDLFRAIYQFIVYKLAPTIHLGSEWLTGKDLFGNPITPLEAFADKLTPLVYDDIKEALENDLLLGSILAPFILLGISVNTFQKKNTRNALRQRFGFEGPITEPENLIKLSKMKKADREDLIDTYSKATQNKIRKKTKSAERRKRLYGK